MVSWSLGGLVYHTSSPAECMAESWDLVSPSVGQTVFTISLSVVVNGCREHWFIQI